MNADADPNQVLEIFGLFDFTKVFFLLIGIIALGVAAAMITGVGSKLHKRFPAHRLFIAQAISVLSFAIYMGGGAYLIYGVIRPPKEMLLAVSGTLAVALGLSLKDLVASVVAGLILLFDKPFQVGDRITFNGMYGEVKAIGLRAVRMVTLDDSLITIPNNRFITEAVSSGNSGALDMMVETNFHIALDADLVFAKQILFDTGVTSRFVFLKKPVIIIANEVPFANRLAMQLRIKCYVLDVRFEKALQTDLIIRGNKALIKNGIARPVFEITSALPSL